MMEKMYNEVML